MNASENSIRWWQRDIDGPIVLPFACSTAVGALLATFAFLIDGGQLAALLLPMGVLGGASLSLQFSTDATTRKWSRFADAILARAVKVVFIFGLPFWVYVAIKYGVGFAMGCLGAISAFLLFSIGGTTALAVAVTHMIFSLRKPLTGA